jgi:hypothetical protein
MPDPPTSDGGSGAQPGGALLHELQEPADRCEARTQSVDQLGEDGAHDVATSFLVAHENRAGLQAEAFAAVARGLKPDGYFLVFGRLYPEIDEVHQRMPACSQTACLTALWGARRWARTPMPWAHGPGSGEKSELADALRA